ncbi:thiaminase II [Flavobacterium sp. NRK F10]|uniref:Aminopyrimidine aminohydrolase n=1 Tax=Flavobacterium sediminis TaxID=2201181 RepID=A0A2U8QW08_9FLAO|nr:MULTISPECIES: thiaminase II [Flavobacterium]AWM14348.1 thiaminase II [Flavobacterium sediminis]MCO6175569.1 thiaminase II [Flavobacterium sp. NRK F10]
MKWSEKTWLSIDGIYESILKMPFIEELSDGSLPMHKFQFYMLQDSLYLEHFGRALALIGAKAYHINDTLAYIRFAENAIVVENALHESYFKDFRVSDKGIIQPACHHYTHFLKSTAAFETVEVAMAATLPCFWIYKNVGEYIHARYQSSNNPFEKWIATYGGEDFTEAVNKAVAICDRAAQNTTPAIRQKMTEAFITASRMEYQFWDAAYKMKRWES